MQPFMQQVLAAVAAFNRKDEKIQAIAVPKVKTKIKDVKTPKVSVKEIR